MAPGLELDMLIAEKVMGLDVVKNKSGSKRGGYYYSIGPASWYDNQGDMILDNPVPPYSQEIASAWLVVDKLGEQQIKIEISPTSDGYAVGYIKYDPTQEFTPWIGIGYSYSTSNSIAHAICLAALKAVT